jgi:hypothetical protein
MIFVVAEGRLLVVVMSRIGWLYDGGIVIGLVI